jgi:GT2 family glycosyltransferase
VISVVTITYNNYKELVSTLESIKGVENIESVVINGGSSVDSFELLKSHAGVVVNEKDEGISDAFNKGWRHSKGDAVAFLNSGDQLIDREYYSWANRVLMEDPTIAFTYSDIVFVDAMSGEMVMKARGRSREDLGKGMPFPHPSMVVRREIFDQIGGFSKKFKIAMDFDFVVRLLVAGHRGAYYPHATVKMDGAGVSTAKEFEGIQECKNSLMQHSEFHGKVAADYKSRIFRYRVRNSLKKVFGNQVLGLLKSLKSKIK